MRVSAKAEYAVLACIELAAAPGGPIKVQEIADARGIPKRFLGTILVDLRNAGVVNSERGGAGGYWLALPADEITLADVMRAVDGRLALIHGATPDAVSYSGVSAPLRDVWLALRAEVRFVLEGVTLADIVDNELPARVVRGNGTGSHSD